MKKKGFDFKRLIVFSIIGGTLTAFGIIFAFIGKAVDFVRAPKVLAGEIDKTNERVDKWADVTQQLADQSKEQQTYNKAVADILRQQNSNEPEVIYSPDKKFIWDYENQRWRPARD